LTTLLVVTLAAGVTAAWSFGRHRSEPVAAIAQYQRGPIEDQSVRLSDQAAAHPRATDVQSVLQQYFDAINNRDYASWMGAVSSDQSAPQTEEQWIQDYSTTVDSNLAVMVMPGRQDLRILDLGPLFDDADSAEPGVLNLVGLSNPLGSAGANYVVWGNVADWSNSYYVVWGNSIQSPSGQYVVWGNNEFSDPNYVVWGNSIGGGH